MKTFPKIGDKLYLQKNTGSYYVDLCKDPYTVINVDSRHVYIQACELVFKGPRYYDTLPDEIKEDPNGEVVVLNWYPKKEKWGMYQCSPRYPYFAHFGKWDYQPYLD